VGEDMLLPLLFLSQPPLSLFAFPQRLFIPHELKKIFNNEKTKCFPPEVLTFFSWLSPFYLNE
jgi:hypothetical protein